MTISTRAFVQGHPRRRSGPAALACSAVLTALLVFIAPAAVHSNDVVPNHIVNTCGTVVMDELYYCYLFKADDNGKIYAVNGLHEYYPGDRLHVQGVAEIGVSFCTIDYMMSEATIDWCDEGACVGDVNGDGVVDIFDLLDILAAWGPCGYGECPADLNGDEVVDIFDLLITLAEWGSCE